MPETDTLTVEDVTRDLNTARAQLRELHGRVAAGDAKVTASDLTDLKSQVEFLELRLESAKESEGRQAEQKRTAELAALIEPIRSGRFAEAHRLGELEKAAVAALTELHTAAVAFVRGNGAAGGELRHLDKRLGPLPDGVEAQLDGLTISDVSLPVKLVWVEEVMQGAITGGIAANLSETVPSTPGSRSVLRDVTRSMKRTAAARRLAQQADG